MNYEFNDEDAPTFVKFSNMSLAIGVIIITFTLTGLIGAFGDDTLADVLYLRMVSAIVEIILGVLFIYPSIHFRRIDTTKGQDIIELMNGLNRQMFSFKWLSILLCVEILLNIAMAIILGG